MRRWIILPLLAVVAVARFAAAQPALEPEPPSAAEPAGPRDAPAPAAAPEAPAPAPSPSPAPTSAPTPVGSLTIDEQVQGTCRSPREAMLQLLYWIQEAEERVDLERAAACLDGTGLAAAVVGERARQLKRTLDARGLYIDIEAIPNSRDHVNGAGIHRWRLPALLAIEIVKLGEQWKFSAATVRQIPALHADTIPPVLERLLAALPAWFHDQVLGVKIWQLCGVLLIILLALTLQRIVVFVIMTYVRRATGRFASKWIDKAASRIARPIGGLAMAGVFFTAGPWLQLSVRVSQVMRVATGALAAYSVAWLVYRMIDVLTDWLEVKAEATDSKLDDQLVPLLRKTLKVFTAVIGAIFVLQNLSVDVGSLLAGLGLGGLAFALAARDTVANFFGSLVVFIDKPFQIGDWVVIDGVEGVVAEVGFRTTRVPDVLRLAGHRPQRQDDRHLDRQLRRAQVPALRGQPRRDLRHPTGEDRGVLRRRARDHPAAAGDAERLRPRRVQHLRRVGAQHHGVLLHGRPRLGVRAAHADPAQPRDVEAGRRARDLVRVPDAHAPHRHPGDADRDRPAGPPRCDPAGGRRPPVRDDRAGQGRRAAPRVTARPGADRA